MASYIQGLLTGVSRTSWTDTKTGVVKDKLHLYVSRPFTKDDFTVRNAGSITYEIIVKDDQIPMWEEDVFKLAEKMVQVTFVKDQYGTKVLGMLKPAAK